LRFHIDQNHVTDEELLCPSEGEKPPVVSLSFQIYSLSGCDEAVHSHLVDAVTKAQAEDGEETMFEKYTRFNLWKLDGLMCVFQTFVSFMSIVKSTALDNSVLFPFFLDGVPEIVVMLSLWKILSCSRLRKLV
jgi:hypothetical protein